MITFFNSLALNYFKSELRIADMRDVMFDETKKRNTDMTDLTWSHHSGIFIIKCFIVLNNYQLLMNISHFKISQHLNI